MTRMHSPVRLLSAAVCALLCLVLSLGHASAQSSPAAPAIDSVTSGDTTLTVAWSAPADETGITAYDVRHIETSGDETTDSNWTVVDNAWTSGSLEHTISMLDNGTQYDVQVRAVKSNEDGTWSTTEVGTPALPAPTIDSVRADDRAVLVSWSAPTGTTTGISAYNLRYIETSADETVDSNWTLVEDAWEDGGGSLAYAVTGLNNGTEYDVQVRAVDVDDVDGAWSATTSATPADHGNTRAAATSITAGARVLGVIDPTDDEDYFSFSVSRTADYWIYTLGDLDTVGELLDSNGMTIDTSDRGGLLPNPDNFFLWHKLQSGTYYIRVTGYGPTDVPYILRVREFTDTTSRSNAATLNLNGTASGTIDPKNDDDYFKLELSAATEVAIRASGFPDTIGELQNSSGTVIAFNDDGFLPGGRTNFLIRESLNAGTYYVKVSSYSSDSDGPYSVYATAITEPGSSKADAQPLTLGVAAGGNIDPAGDEDYFSLTLEETTSVIIGGVSRVVYISGDLADENDLAAPIDSVHFDDSFLFQGSLHAGTYYLKVTGKDAEETGRYTVRAIVESSHTYFVNRCSNIPTSSSINDPLYGCQWHLNNDDQFRDGAGQDIRVEEVWPTYTGSGINVAVVDDGMHYQHEDLTDNVLTGFNHNYDPDQTGIYHSFNNHGTSVAGLIAAKDNGLGMRGVAPEAKIYGYNYLVAQNDANEADAMSRNAATTAISSNSWGPSDSGYPEPATELWEAAVRDGVTTGYGGKGVFYAWAAGNGGIFDYSTLDEYANFYAVTAVCAVGHDDIRSSYSEAGSNLWVCGPSSSGREGQPRIATTDNGHRYQGSFGGTSAATPIVSGVVALVREANNALTWRDVKLILAASARKVDPENTGWVEGAFKYGSSTDRYNFNHEYGFGMVDAKAAVDLARSWTNVPDFREITSESRVINLGIPDLPSSGTPTTVTASLTVDPYVEFVEFVEVNAHFDHPFFRDLVVELVSPSGEVSTLSTSAPVYVTSTTTLRLGSARHLGEDAAGEWTLRIKDADSGGSGTLRSWGLTIYGHGSIPGAPEIDTVTSGGGTLTVNWNAPADTGETAITSYDLRYIREDAADKSDDNWTVETGVGTPVNRSYTITGLEGGVKYEFQLRAHNGSGHGPWSRAVGDEPTTAVPSAPSITSVTRGDRTLAVVWTVPADTGGGVITAYDVRYIETSKDETVDSNWTVRDNAWRSGDLRYVISNLTNATEYDVQVRAVNSAGDGAWSDTETGTPLPDDIPITLQWEETSLEVEEDAGSVVLRAVFTTTLDSPPAADFTFDVTLTTTDTGTTQGDDYTAPPSSATFVASDFSQTDVNGQQRYRATRDFTIAIIDDTTDESNEAFNVRLAYATPGLPHLRGGPSTAVVTIQDNEHVPVTLSWESTEITVGENAGSPTLRAYAVTTVDKRPEDGFSFDASIYTSDGSAGQPGDYTEVDESVTFSRNDFNRVTVNGDRRYRAVKQVPVTIVDDTEDEPDEDFDATVVYADPTLPHLQGGPASTTVTITDNDHVPVTISWDQSSLSVDEDATTVTLQARATTTSDKMPESGFNVALSATTAGDTATEGQDYRRLNSSFTFRQGDFTRTDVGGQFRYQATRDVGVSIREDTVDEPDEDFTVTLNYSNPSLPHLQGGPDIATVTIVDNDHFPVVAGRDSFSVDENDDAFSESYSASDPEGTSTTFTWSLSGTDSGDFNINLDGELTFRNTPNYEDPTDSNRNNEYLVAVVATDEEGLRGLLDVTVTVNDVNEPPTITGEETLSFPENSTRPVETYRASDPERDTITWSVSGLDGGDFHISETGVLTFASAPDFENPDDADGDNDYEVTVQARDDGFNTASLEVVVTVTNSTGTEEPTITTTSRPVLTYQENGTGTVYTYRATDPQGGTITWSVTGTDANDFLISESGALTFRTPPDFENPADSDRDNVYEIRVVATDDQGLTDSFDVTIIVTNHHESLEPAITTGPSSGLTYQQLNYQENRTATVYTYSARNYGAGSLSWSLSGTDAGDFTIATDTSGRGVLTFGSAPDFESPDDLDYDNDYEITVVVTNAGGYSDRLDVVVTVDDVNEGPGISLVGNAPGSVPENQDQMQLLARYRATDPEEPGAVITRWSNSGTDGGDFVMNEQGELRFRYVPDYERPADSNQDNIYNFSVRASDGRYYGYLEVAVTVTPVNEPPTITTTSSSATGLRQQENRTSRLYTYRATDPEGGSTIRWSVGGIDGRFFTINERGEFSFSETSPPDYEMPADSGRDNVYDLTVQARDAEFNTETLDVTVTVTDVNEGPEVTGGGNSFNLQENRQWPGASFTAVDPELGTVTRWSLGGRDGSDFTISENGVMTFRRVPDYERPDDGNQDNVYEVEIRPYDGRYYGSHDVTVTVGDVNEITGTATLSRSENFEGVLAIYRATGQGDLTVSPAWRLTGTDGGDFTISEGGELTFRAVPDHERPADSNRDNEYLFTVQASDDRYYGTVEVTVTVTPVNEPPTITTTSSSATGLRQQENRTSRLYTYRATDPEGSVIAWSVGGADGRFFTINERGEFSFNETSPPDYELPADSGGDNVYDLTVQARDAEFNTETLDVTVTVTDVNEGPEVTGGGNSFNLQENRQWPGASFTAVDPELGTVTRWSLGGRDGSDFTISENGVMTFRRVPDYERPDDGNQDNVYEVEIRPYDGRYYGSHDVTVTVGDVNEITGTATLDRSENFEGVLATYSATGRGDLTVSPAWRLTGTDSGDFTISEGGELAFRAVPDHERPADSNRDNEYLFTAQASDDRYYGTLEVTVTVTPVNEPPTITTRSRTEFTQSENRTTRLYTWRATDPEGGSTITWSLVGADSRFFTINQRGEFSFKETDPPDFEARSDTGRDNVYDVTVQVSDDSSPPNTASLPVTVTVTDVNEGPEITSGGTRFTVEENQDWAGASFTASDPEGEAISRWNLGGRDGGDFTITETGLLTFRSAPDYERPVDSDRNNIYEVEVRPYDGRYYGSHHVTVTVTPINEAPTITTTSTSATSLRQPENRTTRLYSYRATDPEGSTLTWSVAGTDGRFFTIDERGQFSFKAESSPDFEIPSDAGRDNVYDVTVQASDGTLSGTLTVTVTVTDVNEGPEVTSGGDTFIVPENQDWSGASFNASDPEGDAVTRWNLGGRDGGDFTISETGLMTFRNIPDYERPADSGGDNIYEVEVRPYDGRYYGSHDVTVRVTPINEVPEITTTSTSATALRQPENRTSRLYTYRATDPEGSTLTWSVAGTDRRFFTIDERGELSFKEENSPNYEIPSDAGGDNVYDVTVQASDGTLSESLAVAVTVTDANEGPQVTSGGDTFIVQENSEWSGASFTAMDPEGDAVTRWNLGGRDGGDFTINENGAMTFRSTPDYERPADSDRDNVYEVEVRPYDGRYYGSHAVTVTVGDVNEISGSATITQPEKFVGLLATYSAGGRGDLIVEPNWRLTGADSGDFSISEGGELTFRSIPDHERPADSNRDNEYLFTVQASDDRYYGTMDVTVTVTPVNEPPTITTTSTSATTMRQAENRTSRLYTYRATDPETSAITWSVSGTHARFFTISERGELFFSETSPPDFENPLGSGTDGQEYQVTVQASDDSIPANTASLPVTVTITDVNEGPEITRIGNLQGSVPENQARETELARYSAADPEDTGATITRWSTSGRDGGDFVISEQGELRFRNSPDFERPADSDRDNVYEVTIRASDGRYTGTLEETQVVTVTNVNEEPVITTRSRTEFTQRENTASVLYTYRATDPDSNDVIRWSVEGADGGDFAIFGGVLTFRRLPDYEIPVDSNGDNLYEIAVVASDLQGARDTVDAAITITEVNEGPKVSGTTAFTVVEGQDLLGASFSASDQEGDEVTRWSLSGSDGGDFEISEFGVLTFRNLPDYDRPADSNRDNEYLVSVRAYDSGNRYGSLDLTVTVTDVNEEAPVVTGRTSLSFRENTTTETRLYTFRATDSDRNTSFIWSVEGDDGGDFAIDEGVLTFRSPPDYEQPADSDSDNVYEIAVVASDGSNRGELPVTVTVTEINEGPELSGTGTYTIPETQDNLVNATFTAVDPEGDTVTSWRLAGADGGDFTITDSSEQTGRNTADLTFRNPPDVDRPADSNRDNEYLVTIRAYDNRGRYGSYDVTVTVTGANEPPVITGSDARTFTENGTGTIYTYRATDPERDEFSWIQPAGDDGHLFDISDRGALTFKEPPDFDSPRDLDRDNDYEVTVRAEDSDSSIGTFEVTVTVTDQNEGATVSGQAEIEVQENRDPTLALATYSATDPEGQAITRWSLSGSDSGDFTIDEVGALTFRNTPDYDRPADSNRDSEYLVTVRAYDGRSYGTLDVTVTVTNENEHAPVIRSGSRTFFTYREEDTSALYTYSATDDDRDDVIAWTAGGTDGSIFEFNDRNGLMFREPPDYENPGDSGRDNEYELTVVATDTGLLNDSLAVTVTVTALDEGPEITGAAAYTVAEGLALSSATFTARDPDPGEWDDAVTGWRLAGTDAGDFNIGPTGTNSAQLTFRNTPDYDSPADSNRDNEYLVTVRAYNGSAYGSLDVTVTVTDQNEADPVVTGSQTLSFRENTDTETRLYTYRATDMDRDTEIMWSLEGDDRGDFAIDEGVLTFSSLPNYEQPADSDTDSVYEITAVASDGSNEGTLDVTITVTDVNEGPEVTGQAGREVSENFDQVVATYTATDPEGSDVTRWTLGGSDSGDLTITDTSQEGGPFTAELTFRNPPDFDRPADSNKDNEYLVTVRPYDGRNYGNYEVTVTVTSDNEPPVITGDDTRDFRENGTGTIYTYRATDPEGDDFTWSVGGQDASYFDISDTGVLTFQTPPDFESPPRPGDNDYQVTVQARDDQGGTGAFDVTVTVTDLNEGPEIAETSSNTAITVRENHDQILSTYTATDPEDPTADITRWSVTGRDGGDFTINEDGELTFRNLPDHERPADSDSDNVYEVTVRASDGRYYGTLDVTVIVEAVDEAPEFRSGSTDTFTYQENGTSDLYTYRATDPEGSDVTWHLSGADSDSFEISETGVLTFGNSPDYEDPADSNRDNVYQVTVVARDEQGRDRNLEVTVTVTNVTD